MISRTGAALLLAGTLHAVEVRVATYNIGAHFSEGGYPDYSLGNPGTTDHDAVRAVLRRIDADVVALQEVHSADVAGSPDDLDALAAAIGCPHVYVASTSGSFDTSLRVAFLSRHPFRSTESVNSPPGTKEITRLFPAVGVDVPGTDADPVLVSAHLKAGTTSADKFRRAVEMRRLAGWLAASGLDASDNFIVLGDFNPSGTAASYGSLPSGLPGSYELGPDIGFPVTYTTQFGSYFLGPVPTRLAPRQLDGSDGTFQYGQTLDLLFVSPGLAGRPHATEIYNSAFDLSNASGLPKWGLPLAASTSLDASDHYAVFGDFELDSDLSDLGLAVSAPSVAEDDPAGSVMLTVSLPEPAVGTVEVLLASSDPAVAPVDGVLSIPAGGRGASTGLRSRRNFLVDGTRNVTFTATAGGYDAGEASVPLLDADAAYVLGQPGEVLLEDFDGFGGWHDPAPWAGDGASWLGSDDGGSATPGARAYGDPVDRAPGFVVDEAGGSFLEASYTNGSAVPLTMVDLAYDAEQWRSAPGGAGDAIAVELVLGGIPVAVPELAFSARTDLSAGAVVGGMPARRSARVEGLSVGPGESFSLRFRFVPGAGSAPASTDVWINEFHYDNAGTDSGEFLEVVVAPGFSGLLAELEIVRYNGSNPSAATVDGPPLNLASDFTEAGNYDGYRIFVAELPTNGIQNGGNDGFAVVNLASAELLHLISYEGSFTAGEGVAVGQASADIGVDESNSDPLGGSLGLVGSGSAAGGFSWEKFDTHSMGAPNPGQALVAPGLPPQGLAIDEVTVGFVSDHDLDGVPDDEDPDDDNDGQADGFELAFGTDPHDRGSVFRPRVRIEAGQAVLSFPGADGVVYTIQWGDDLVSWDQEATVVGEGAELVFPLPTGGGRGFARVVAGG